MEKVRFSYILKLTVIGFILMFAAAATITRIISALSTISMPDLTGIKLDRAQKLAFRMKIDLKVEDEINSPLYDAGSIIAQDIQARSEIKKGRTVYVVVSKGFKLVQIPDITDRPKAEALVMIKNAGLLEGFDAIIASPSIKDTNVISESPGAGQVVPAGIKINMLRSSGPRVKNFVMPRLTGRDTMEVFSILKSRDLHIESLSAESGGSETSGSAASGVIISQSPQAGFLVNEKSAITLRASINENDTRLKKRMINISYTSASTTPQLIRINVLSLNGSETVYNEVAQPNDPVSVSAAVRGQAVVQIYGGTEL
ncbi:MAG: PASTA domain-containing protein, partial [Candidatus Goldiibacteriota bacterium]